MRVAVLGGGHGAYAVAADLGSAGHEVRLWRRASGELAAVRSAGGLAMVVNGRRNRVGLTVVAELAEAVAGADAIVAAVPGTAHADLAARLAPHLDAGQVVVVTTGTLGGLLMAREITRLGGKLPQAFVETGTRAYRAMKTGPAEVQILTKAATLPVAVFPAARSAAALGPVSQLFAGTRRCVDILDAALLDGGPVIHPALVLLNLGAIDQSRALDAANPTSSARQLIGTVDAERLAARAGWGYPKLAYEVLGDDATGPVTLEHRYVVEDAALGLSLFESAARTVGAETPAISGLLLVFTALLGRPLSGRGRALEHLGLGDLVLREIRELLQEGWTSPLWRRITR
jgi:opine dehydrogenase